MRIKQNDVLPLNKLKFGFLKSKYAPAHCDFLKYLRNKPELLYNILSFDNKIISDEIGKIIKIRKIEEEKKKEKMEKKAKENEKIKDTIKEEEKKIDEKEKRKEMEKNRRESGNTRTKTKDLQFYLIIYLIYFMEVQ